MLFDSVSKGRVILLDWGIFTHRAIFAYAAALKRGGSYITQSPNMCMSMIISNLCKIGVKEDDLIIIAKDSPKGSWRKQYKNEYKADRGEKRKQTENETGINWKEEWNKMNWLGEQFDLYSPFHSVEIDHIEADDIMAVACQYYSDREVILVTYDADLEQMWHFDNVKIYSQHPARKNYPWKIPPVNFDALNKIVKEIGKNTHNNLSGEVLNERDYEIKKLIIDLINLPPEITEPIIEEFKKIKDKENVDISKLPYPSLVKRFPNIYRKEKIITYEKCVKNARKKKRR